MGRGNLLGHRFREGPQFGERSRRIVGEIALGKRGQPEKPLVILLEEIEVRCSPSHFTTIATDATGSTHFDRNCAVCPTDSFWTARRIQRTTVAAR